MNEWGEIRAILSNDVIIPRLCVSVRVTRMGAGNHGHEHHGYNGNHHRYDNGHHDWHEHHWHYRHHHGYDGDHHRYDNGHHHKHPSKHPATRGLIA